MVKIEKKVTIFDFGLQMGDFRFANKPK